MGLNQRLVTDIVFRSGAPAPLLAPLVNNIASPTAIPSILLGPIPPGATVIVQHGLHEDLLGPVEPTIVFPDRASPLVITAADKFTFTIHNPGNDLGDDQEVFFRAERKHTLEENPKLLLDMLWQGAANIPQPDTQDMDISGCIGAGVTAVRIDTTEEEILAYLPLLSSGPDGRMISIRIITGTLDAILLPATLAEGVNGPPGSTYTLDPVLGEAVTLEADIARSTWWKV